MEMFPVKIPLKWKWKFLKLWVDNIAKDGEQLSVCDISAEYVYSYRWFSAYSCNKEAVPGRELIHIWFIEVVIMPRLLSGFTWDYLQHYHCVFGVQYVCPFASYIYNMLITGKHQKLANKHSCCRLTNPVIILSVYYKDFFGQNLQPNDRS